MHIKRLVVEGFKCYKDRIEADPFSPKHNVVVGANGSGKSNFFAAIQFVLGDVTGGALRAEERKQLLHEGAGAHVMSAYVEIYLDNSDGRLPVERDEVVLKRAIGLKKDEYFLDRKHVTKNEVINLLESAGFSRSNPYNIVPQGKVNMLTTMKDEQRLELLKEVAGTRTYGERRQESLNIMLETAARREKISEMLAYIEKRLQELDAEKEELALYQRLDKQRKSAEYAYYDKELRKAKLELDKMDSRRLEEGSVATELQQKEEEVKTKSKEVEKELKTAHTNLAHVEEEFKSLKSEHKKLLTEAARLELQAKQEAADVTARTASEREARADLSSVNKHVETLEKQLEAARPECAAKVARAEELVAQVEDREERLQGLYAKQSRNTKFKSKAARDKHIKGEVASVQESLKGKEEMIKKQQAEAEAQASEAATAATAARTRLEELRKQEETAKAACSGLRHERDKFTEQRKTLWRKEQALSEELQAAKADHEKAQRTLQHSMSRSQWEAVSAVKRIAQEKGIKGVEGMLIELFEVDEKFFTAVEVAASNQLFQVVVDTDDTAAVMLRELQRANAGRVTFMPLNRLRPGPDPKYPESEDVIPVMSRLKFDPRFRPALSQVFRKCLIVRNLEVGSRFSKSHDLDCITLEGDQVNRKGALSGGYVDVRRSRLKARAEMTKLGQTCADADKALAEMQHQAEQVDHEVTRVLGELKKQEAVHHRAATALEQERLDLPSSSQLTGRGTDARKEKALTALRKAAEADRRRLEALQQELATDFGDELTAEEAALQEELQEELRELQKQRIAAQRERAKAEQHQGSLETELNENWKRRQRELQESLDKLRDEGRSSSHDSAAALEAAQAELRHKAELRDEAQRRAEELRQQERALNASVDDLKAQLAAFRERQAEKAKELDRLLSRRSTLQHKQAEFQDCIRKLGALPKDAFGDSRRDKSSKELMSEIEHCMKELQKLGHVNKKALDQFANFNEQRDRLLERQGELDEAESSIKALIDHLDQKKDEAMERTFKGVAKHFAEVFRELVPGGTGKLVMKTDGARALEAAPSSAAARIATYSGISIKVQFVGGADTYTMQQLSGGQKTMVALCLIFAIQRCDPAPFYLFDEIDANLDAAHRASLAKMIERQAMETDEAGEERPPTQFITTTFRPELIHTGDKFYGVTHRSKASSVKTIDKAEALRIITEDQSRLRQHASAV